jgi:hypothetical protein
MFSLSVRKMMLKIITMAKTEEGGGGLEHAAENRTGHEVSTHFLTFLIFLGMEIQKRPVIPPY